MKGNLYIRRVKLKNVASFWFFPIGSYQYFFHALNAPQTYGKERSQKTGYK